MPAEDIKAQLGSTWIPVEYVTEFAHELFNESYYSSTEINYDKITAQYYIAKPNYWSMGAEAKETWGVATSENVSYPKRQPDYTGYDLLDDVLNSRIPTIRNYWDEWEEGNKKVRSEVNAERTSAARDLAEQLEEQWEEWLYSDYVRKQKLVEIYNRKFNNIRLREYDGSFLSFPDMNCSIHLEPYQKNAIARIMDTNTNTLLWQQVGAGKTFEMVAITIDPCFNGRSTNYSEIKTLCSKLNIKYKVKQSRLGELIFNERKEKNPCSLCARMRRGMLHDLAKELECNKIALGHNLEDSVETFFMNLFDCGKIGCFSPVTYLSRKNLYMIRPLIFCNEAKIDAFIKQKNLPVVKSHCPANFNTNRQTTKELILKLEKKYPNLRLKIIGAISKSNIDGWKN